MRKQEFWGAERTHIVNSKLLIIHRINPMNIRGMMDTKFLLYFIVLLQSELEVPWFVQGNSTWYCTSLMLRTWDAYITVLCLIDMILIECQYAISVDKILRDWLLGFPIKDLRNINTVLLLNRSLANILGFLKFLAF